MKDQIKLAIQAIQEGETSKGVDILQSIIKENVTGKIASEKNQILTLHKFMEMKHKEELDEEDDDSKEKNKDDDDSEEDKDNKDD